MRITSKAFGHNGTIPAKYTCQGEDIHPPLQFHDLPDETKSLALIMDDPDAPHGTWDHWILFNMNVVSAIEERGELPDGSVIGTNSWGRIRYGGPCPPSGTHRYFFKLYALDCKLNLESTARKAAVEVAMKGHIIAQAELIGLYQKS
jgi:Raf kinase inhibitor-like YbhB/YbcL family protein